MRLHKFVDNITENHNIIAFELLLTNFETSADKENLSRWWGEDRENLRNEHLSLDQVLAMSKREVHSQGFTYPHLINVINYLSCLFLA